MIGDAVEIILQGNHLSKSQMQEVMEEIMSGNARTSEIVSFLTALSKIGETAQDLAAAAEIMRSYATKINTKQKIILDTCGTGGDGLGTFNVSTAVAFVACGCGITVAKHGNRSVSSRTGSADILEALGINLYISKERLEKCLDEIGIAFLFAPELQPAMKYAMPARRQIGKKTMFNLLGPLSNPAGATHQLIGVFDFHLNRILAEALNSLGTRHALVVSGKDGLDELTTTTGSRITEVLKGKINDYEITPEDFGIKRAELEDLAGGDASCNAKIMLDILNGNPGPKQDIVVLNAAAAVYAADKAGSIKEGIGLARDAIDSKKALEKFELLKQYSQN